ncbi:uncharacterized protein CLUP02_00355 [Colletotrichum lupini]|uniref:Uncharacterized protein n=1 Tax=Colletotrichum lupini TaxID=145971 RepID=A0A9Q8SAL0_9PEZI|nr:uncharacterized protein CLUP02_00355 [Colletotrichum lupini]UQC73709.1 hypothetical protein CLUP02_00355 [Colletotrichum lupini]
MSNEHDMKRWEQRNKLSILSTQNRQNVHLSSDHNDLADIPSDHGNNSDEMSPPRHGDHSDPPAEECREGETAKHPKPRGSSSNELGAGRAAQQQIDKKIPGGRMGFSLAGPRMTRHPST